jgi:hypothetical protein
MIGAVLSRVAFSAIFLCLLTGGALAQEGQRSIPDAFALIRLVRTTMIAVDHANRTGNYTVLRDLGAPGFSKNNDAARLADIFRAWRERKLDLGAVVLLKPTWTVEPEIDRAGMLRLTGYFATKPLAITFDLLYESIGDRWRLFGISIDARKP